MFISSSQPATEYLSAKLKTAHMQMPRMKLAPMAGHVSRLTPEAAWAAAWIEAQDLVKQLQAAIARGDVALRGRAVAPPVASAGGATC